MINLAKDTTLRGGTYKIEQVLGQGSFGITYLAKHTNLDKKVAIKEFFMKELNSRGDDGSITGMTDGSLSHSYCVKFQKEAINLSRLDHPNIVRVTDSFSENGTFYYVMDYIEGQNLNDYVKSHYVDEAEAVSIIKSVASALIYMHDEKHMLHLDLKPSNVMRRDSDGHIFLIDFGLSKHFSEDGQPETSTTIGLGTAGYAPIEQGDKAKNGEFRPTIDVYALGATLYKLLTRETPPQASDLVSDEDLLEDNLRAKGVSDYLIKVVSQAMCPSVKKRTQTVRDLKNSLEEIKTKAETTVAEASDDTIVNVDTESTIVTQLSNDAEAVSAKEESNDTEGDAILVNADSDDTFSKESKLYSIFSFKGRIGRLPYFLISLGGMFVFFLPMIFAAILMGNYTSNYLFATCGMLWAVFYYYIMYAVGAKRCHDLGHSGWFQLIPFYALFMLFKAGSEEANVYGKKSNGISRDSLKNIGIIAAIAYVIFLAIGLGQKYSYAGSSDNSYQNEEIDSVQIDTVVVDTAADAVLNVTNEDMTLAGARCVYSGEVIENADDTGYLPNGMGEVTFSDGRYYKGHFTYGEMDDTDAFFSFPNGDKFVGSFANNEFKEGKYTVHETGEEFVGTFKNGQPKTGAWYDKNGKFLETI